jgi:hypothetical protein
MAALQGTVNFGVGASVALVTATAKTVVILSAPTHQRVKILGYGFYFDGTSNSAQPVEIYLKHGSTAGTSTAYTPYPSEEDLTGDTFQTVAGVNATVEPTYTANAFIKTFTVHPQLGYEYLAPLGQEDVMKPGGFLGFIATAPAGVNIRGYVKFEE